MLLEAIQFTYIHTYVEFGFYDWVTFRQNAGLGGKCYRLFECRVMDKVMNEKLKVNHRLFVMVVGSPVRAYSNIFSVKIVPVFFVRYDCLDFKTLPSNLRNVSTSPRADCNKLETLVLLVFSFGLSFPFSCPFSCQEKRSQY